MHVNSTWGWYTDQLGFGSHNLKTGYVFTFEEYRFPQYGTLDHAVYYYRNNFQTPAFVETYDTPLETIDRLRQHSAFVNDRWTVGRHVTLNFGVRLDSYTNYYLPRAIRAPARLPRRSRCRGGRCLRSRTGSRGSRPSTISSGTARPRSKRATVGTLTIRGSRCRRR